MNRETRKMEEVVIDAMFKDWDDGTVSAVPRCGKIYKIKLFVFLNNTDCI